MHKSSKNALKLWNAMFQYATEGIVISNHKGEIILANPTSAKQLGYAEGELVGRKIEELVPSRFSDHWWRRPVCPSGQRSLIYIGLYLFLFP